MYTQPMIFPFDIDGTIYVVQDEQGETIGTGSRDVCAGLLSIMKRAGSLPTVEPSQKRTRTEVRSAIVV